MPAITGISITDADAISRGETFTVSLTDSFGKLSAGNTGGATVSGSGTASLIISGSFSQINAALPTLTHFPYTTLFRSESIAVTTTDSDGSTTGSKSINVSIVAGDD